MSDLVRYSPEKEFRRAMRLMRNFLDDPLYPAAWDPFSLRFPDPLDLLRYSPFDYLQDFFPGDNLAIDLYEEDDRLVVEAALPGVRKENVEITLQDGFLTIRATDKADVKREGAGWLLREKRYGVWQRSLRLPAGVDADHADATLENGVLTISLPKREREKKLVRRIKVNLPKIKMPSLKKERKIKVKQAA